MNIYEMFEKIEENYNLVELVDSCDETSYGYLYLNKKHSIDDFQNAIYKAKEKRAEDIDLYGDDWSFIQEELEDFDYYELGSGSYWVEY